MYDPRAAYHQPPNQGFTSPEPSFFTPSQQSFPSAIGPPDDQMGSRARNGVGFENTSHRSGGSLEERLEYLEWEHENLRAQAIAQENKLQNLERRVCMFLGRIARVEANARARASH